MKVRRYQVRESVDIDAPLERVYDFATNPDLVPSYATEVTRIEILQQSTSRAALVKSHLKIAGLTFGYLYKYRYRRPTHYSGVQQAGALRGYFTLKFKANGDGTTVDHTEGLLSMIPMLAWLSGVVYFRLLERGGLKEELNRLKSLIETRT